MQWLLGLHQVLPTNRRKCLPGWSGLEYPRNRQSFESVYSQTYVVHRRATARRQPAPLQLRPLRSTSLELHLFAKRDCTALGLRRERTYRTFPCLSCQKLLTTSIPSREQCLSDLTRPAPSIHFRSPTAKNE